MLLNQLNVRKADRALIKLRAAAAAEEKEAAAKAVVAAEEERRGRLLGAFVDCMGTKA